MYESVNSDVIVFKYFIASVGSESIHPRVNDVLTKPVRLVKILYVISC